MRLKIVIDDERQAPEGWTLYKNPEEFIAWRRNNQDTYIDIISLDHDMGLDHMDGYEFVQYLVEVYSMNINQVGKIQFHTANPVGLTNMAKYLQNAVKHLQLDTKVNPNPIRLIAGRFYHT